MSRLYLLRHARAVPAHPGLRDYDRPLDVIGRADAEALGQEMRRCGYVPTTALCSSALRTRQTMAGVAGALSGPRSTIGVAFSDGLYSVVADGCLGLIRSSGETEALLVVGHNPTMHALAQALSGGGDADALRSLARAFPPAGLAVITFDVGLDAIAAGGGYLEALILPATG